MGQICDTWLLLVSKSDGMKIVRVGCDEDGFSRM